LFTVPVGQYVKFQCRIHGDPKPEKIWLKNQKPITANQKYNMNANSLTINDVELNDAGIYVCQAINDYSLLRINYTLNVLEMPAHDQPVRTIDSIEELEEDSLSRTSNGMI